MVADCLAYSDKSDQRRKRMRNGVNSTPAKEGWPFKVRGNGECASIADLSSLECAEAACT